MPSSSSSSQTTRLKHTDMLINVLIKKVSAWTRKGASCKEAMTRLVSEEPDLLRDEALLQVVYNACCEDAGTPQCDSAYDTPASPASPLDSQPSLSDTSEEDGDDLWTEPPQKPAAPGRLKSSSSRP